MALYAAIDNAKIVSTREIADWGTYPQYKKDARDEKGDGHAVLRPVVGAQPPHDEMTETITGPELQIETDHVKRVWQIALRPLQDVIRTYSEKVDAEAEKQRLRFITAGQGMAMTYQEKKDQALAVLDLGSDAANALANNGAAEYPLLSASVGTEVPTLYQAAELVMERYEAWSAIGGAIETQRLIAKKAISDASNVAQVKAAYEAIQWPA